MLAFRPRRTNKQRAGWSLSELPIMLPNLLFLQRDGAIWHHHSEKQNRQVTDQLNGWNQRRRWIMPQSPVTRFKSYVAQVFFFFFFFFFFKGKGITHDEAYERELCGAFVLLLSISQETDSRWRGSWRMRCNKRPVAVHGWLTPGSPPDQLHVLMNQSWHRNTLGYLVHEIVAANFRVSCNFKTLLSFVDSGGLCGENQRLLW